jgi:hypothetical protein
VGAPGRLGVVSEREAVHCVEVPAVRDGCADGLAILLWIGAVPALGGRWWLTGEVMLAKKPVELEVQVESGVMHVLAAGRRASSRACTVLHCTALHCTSHH